MEEEEEEEDDLVIKYSKFLSETGNTCVDEDLYAVSQRRQYSGHTTRFPIVIEGLLCIGSTSEYRIQRHRRIGFVILKTPLFSICPFPVFPIPPIVSVNANLNVNGGYSA